MTELTKKRRVVSLDSNYYEVLLDNKGFKLEPISAEEYASYVVDRIVLADSDNVDESENVFQQAIDDAQKTLKDTLNKNIKGTVLEVLGFSKDSWGGGFKVDHCNGRMSSVTNHLTQQVRDRLLNVDIAADLNLTEAETNQLKLEMRDEFFKQYKYELKEKVRREARDMAHKHMESYIKELVNNKMGNMASTLVDEVLKVKR